MRRINSGQSPVFEPGVDQLLGDALAGGRLRASNHPERDLQTVISCSCV